MPMTSLQVRRTAFAETRIVESAIPELAEGQILAKVDKFALTANNVTYALAGDALGYWKFFPVEEPWGIVPVWGFADVVASRSPEIPVGERLWGYWPMASHVVLTPSRVSPRGFFDASPHRQSLAATYNSYARTANDPPELKAIEDQRCILFPLYATSYILYDYLVDNAFFGAEDVLITSISSKTGMGLGKLIMDHGEGRPRVIGLTSPANVDYVKGLGVCDVVATYESIPELDAIAHGGLRRHGRTGRRRRRRARALRREPEGEHRGRRHALGKPALLQQARPRDAAHVLFRARAARQARPGLGSRGGDAPRAGGLPSPCARSSRRR